MATVLSQSPTCSCLHEPYPQLIAESARYRYGELEGAKLVDVLRDSRPRDRGTEVYGECANRLAYLAPVLREAFPEAQFVHLIRDGRQFVSSAVQRGWYGPEERGAHLSEWQRWRLAGDRAGVVPADEWASMDQFERCCWLWAYTNELLSQDLQHADTTLLRIEDLEDDLPGLCAHLGIRATGFTIVHANRRRTSSDPEGADQRRTNMVKRILTAADWTAELHEFFDARCGAVMDEHYPGWRDKVVPTPPASSRWSGQGPDHPVTTDGNGGRNAGISEEGTVVRLAAIESSLQAVHTQLAELALLRKEHRTLLAEYQRSLRRTDEVAQERDRAATTAANDRKEIAGIERRLAAANATLEEQRELAVARSVQLRELRRSRTHRAGMAVARVALAPQRFGRTAARVLLRALPPEQQFRLRTLAGRIRAEGTPAIGVLHEPAPIMRLPPDDGAPAPRPLLAVVLDATEQQLASVLDLLVEQAPRPPAVVVVTDCDAFHLFRRTPVPFEYVPPYADWAQRPAPPPYEAFVSRRLTAIIELYRPRDMTLWAGADGNPTVTAALGVLRGRQANQTCTKG